jgi:hypothetical protein
MNGIEYEQLVRAVLVKTLKIDPTELKSAREEGATLPGTPELKHQIDLFHIDRTEIADYITVIECKFRGSSPVDQEELAKLAVRSEVERLANNPEIRRKASQFLRENPDIERKARDFLGGGGRGLF